MLWKLLVDKRYLKYQEFTVMIQKLSFIKKIQNYICIMIHFIQTIFLFPVFRVRILNILMEN